MPRSKLRYPSDLTDQEWALVKSSIPRARQGGNKRTVDVRKVLSGLIYVLSTGCQWRAIPKDLPPRSTVNYYFCRWQHDGTAARPRRYPRLDRLPHKLYVLCREQADRSASPSVAVIDSQSVKRALASCRSLSGTNRLGHAVLMTPEPATYPGYRFPAEIISQAVWLYHCFSLSLRDVELILAERGVIVTRESVRQWCIRFGSDFAHKLRCRRPRPGDTWHVDEVFLKINGVLHYLWRAVDQTGVVLDILVQEHRNAAAARRFFKRLLTSLKSRPRRIVTDGLKSYGVAHRELMPDVRHRTSRYLNNRAENSHRPTRRRERQMQHFKSPEQAQRFLSAHAMIYGHFRPPRHLMTAAQHRRARTKAFRVWRQETCVQATA